jgi:hypothetical protein
LQVHALGLLPGGADRAGRQGHRHQAAGAARTCGTPDGEQAGGIAAISATTADGLREDAIRLIA